MSLGSRKQLNFLSTSHIEEKASTMNPLKVFGSLKAVCAHHHRQAMLDLNQLIENRTKLNLIYSFLCHEVPSTAMDFVCMRFLCVCVSECACIPMEQVMLQGS